MKTRDISLIKDALEKDLEIEDKGQASVLSNLKLEQTQIKNKVMNWNLRCAEDISITNIERNEVLNPLKKRQTEIESEIETGNIGNEAFKITTFHLLDLASRSYEIFKSSHTTEKREILNLVFPNLLLNGEKLDITYAKPFDLFVNLREFQEWSGWRESNPPS